jgi:hypothetical protein
MYEVVVSVVGLALLVAVLLFDCRVRVEAIRPAGTWHFSDRLLQSTCAALRRSVSLLSIRRSGAVEPSRRKRICLKRAPTRRSDGSRRRGAPMRASIISMPPSRPAMPSRVRRGAPRSR